MKLIDRWMKRIILLAIPVIILLLLLQRLHVFSSIQNWLKPKPVLIDNTPLVITQVKTLAQLNTAVFVQEIVLDSIVDIPAKTPNIFMPIPFVNENKKELVLIVKGKVTAGIDLKNLPDSAIYVKGDSAALKLPSAQITDVFVNPSGVETFYENGTWSSDESKAVLVSAKSKLVAASQSHQLILKANEKASLVLKQFLNLSGFKKVVISFY